MLRPNPGGACAPAPTTDISAEPLRQESLVFAADFAIELTNDTEHIERFREDVRLIGRLVAVPRRAPLASLRAHFSALANASAWRLVLGILQIFRRLVRGLLGIVDTVLCVL